MSLGYIAIFHCQPGQKCTHYATVRIGNFVSRHRVFFPLAFVIGDGLSGDQLCGRYKNYSHHVARLSRACDVSFDYSNKPDWVCNYLKMSALQELSIRALELSGFIVNENDDAIPNFQRQVQLNEHFGKLKKLAHHMHDNAFDTV